jgi:hypothetical protein
LRQCFRRRWTTLRHTIMNQRSEEGLFQVLEKELKAAKEPVDCVELYNKSMAIRELAATPNRVSDYLGNMWRKGQLVRVPAPRGEGNKSRWLYAWKGKKPAPKPPVEAGISFDAQVHTLLHKPNLRIEEDGKRVIIDTPYLVITIDTKEPE